MTPSNYDLRDWLIDHNLVSQDATNQDCHDAAVAALAAGQLDHDTINHFSQEYEGKSMTSTEAFGGTDKSGTVNVKDASARYSDVTYPSKHVKTGQAVRDEKGREARNPSERDYARIGAFMKDRARRDGVKDVMLTEHERALVDEMYSEKTLWVGEVQGQQRNDIPGTQVKALLSDNTSGGVSVNPLWYDQAIVSYPLLSGELFPFVDLTEVPRSNVVNSAAVGNPTVTWTGQESASAVSLFDTTGLVTPLNTSIYPVMCAIEMGRDELADSIVDLGRYVVENMGQRVTHELDRVIAVGDGTTQPQGIVNASGVTVLPNIANGVGPLTAADFEALMFGVPKQYRKPTMRCSFISSDVTYSRARAVPRGPNDAARLFGMDEQSYTLLNNPYRVSNDLANNYIIFGAMARYRMYRRAGSDIRYVTEGQTLALKNTVLIVMRGRYGGRVIDPNAFTMETNAPA